MARLFLSLIFLLSGFGKLRDWNGTSEYMEAYGFFGVPFFLTASIVLELGGGLSVLLGYRARLGALALMIFLVAATIIFHAFWSAPPDEYRMQMINFMKNCSIFGGLLLILAHGAGAFSVDARLRRTNST